MDQDQRMLQALETVDYLDRVLNPLGRHHVAADWLEDGDQTWYYLATDGDFYRLGEEGREFVDTLAPEALEKLK